MDNKELLKKIYSGGLQNHIERDEVKIYLNNMRNDCLDYCIKDFSQKKLNQEEIDCVKNYAGKNSYFLSGLIKQ
jgi:hypothetical protein